MKRFLFFLVVSFLGWVSFAANACAQQIFQNESLTIEYYSRQDGKLHLDKAWEIPEAERQKTYEALIRGKPRYDLKNGVPDKGNGGSFRLVFRDKNGHNRLIAYAYPEAILLQEVTDYETLFYQDKKHFMLFLIQEAKYKGIKKTDMPSLHCDAPLVTVVYNLFDEKKMAKYKMKNPQFPICDAQTLYRYNEFLKDIPEMKRDSLAPWSKPGFGSFLFFKKKTEADFPEDVAVYPGYIQVSEAVWSEYAVQDTGGLYALLKKDTDIE